MWVTKSHQTSLFCSVDAVQQHSVSLEAVNTRLAMLFSGHLSSVDCRSKVSTIYNNLLIDLK